MRRWARRVLAPAALTLCVLSAACGGSAGGDTPAVASAGDGKAKSSSDKKPTTEADRQQAGLDFARCMREHGVDVPDPQTTADGGGLIMVGPAPGAATGGPERSGPPAGFEEADKACRHFLEDLVQDGGGPIDPKEQDRALKFAQCMREHGVNMPDPDFSDGRVQIKIEGGSTMSPETLQAAQKACGGLFGPGGGAGGGPGFGVTAGPRS